MIDIAAQRLRNQHLTGPPFEQAEEVVAWLGAVQAQDFLGAKWGIAQRSATLSSAGIDQAYAQGSILRTHIMRPTWHFVTPKDIRWMLELTAPRVNAANAAYYRKTGLDEPIFARSNALLTQVLAGGNHLTRSELESALLQANIYSRTDDRLRLVYLLMRAELDGVICSGGLRGKQHTYALLNERAPLARSLDREEALAELTLRYFTSHGPATQKDFAWWSGLAPADTRIGIELVKAQLEQAVVASKTYWFSAQSPFQESRPPVAHLLPAFDEFTVAYQDSSAMPDMATTLPPQVTLGPVIAIDGRISGSWKRTIGKGIVSIQLEPFLLLTESQEQTIQAAAHRYGAFLGLPVVLSW
jgi:hypothetical protein